MSDPKIVAMYRIQNEERWIEKSLEQTSKVCQEIVILDDCSTDNTVNICKKFPKVVDIYERKELLPLDEVRDRNLLLQMALKRNPDYVLALDGDEILMPNSKEILFEELNVLYPKNLVFSFQVLYIWDTPDQFRFDGTYGHVWRPRLFKIKNQPTDLCYKNSIYPGNLHCNSIPDNTIGLDSHTRSNIKILHYGYYDDKIRTQNYNFYTSHDVENKEDDSYMFLISGKGSWSGPNGMEFQKLPDWMYYKL